MCRAETEALPPRRTYIAVDDRLALVELLGCWDFEHEGREVDDETTDALNRLRRAAES